MKLLSSSAGKWVFRLSRRDLDALRTTLQLRVLLQRQPRSITSDTATTQELMTAQADFDDALNEHRRELNEAVDRLLADPERCVVAKSGACDLTLTASDAELLLQALNEVRVGAWEKLGRPDFESGELPEPSETNLHAYWALQLTDGFQGQILMALANGE